jgi:polyhydroxybutyrate depolymerase
MVSSRLIGLTCSLALLGAVVGCSSTSTDGTPAPVESAGSAGTDSTGVGGQVVTSGAGGSSDETGGSSSGTSGAGGNGTGGSGGTGSTSMMDAAIDHAVDASAPRDSGFSAPSDASVPSDGCGKAAGQALASYVQKTLGGSTRTYKVYLPTGYEPMRAYPTIVLGHGCGGGGGLPFPIEQASKTDAIVVALKSVGDCFEYSPTGPDVTYFDQVLAEVETNHCVNKSKVFMAGFSSGSWLTHTLGCVRAGIIRGQGNASGNQVNLTNCKGPIAAMFAHDLNDDQNSYAGGEKARDRILKMNGCSLTDTVPYDYDGDPATPSTCVSYTGCMPGYPVVWCPTMAKPGQPTHNSQVPISTVGFWRFWSSL